MPNQVNLLSILILFLSAHQLGTTISSYANKNNYWKFTGRVPLLWLLVASASLTVVLLTYNYFVLQRLYVSIKVIRSRDKPHVPSVAGRTSMLPGEQKDKCWIKQKKCWGRYLIPIITSLIAGSLLKVSSLLSRVFPWPHIWSAQNLTWFKHIPPRRALVHHNVIVNSKWLLWKTLCCGQKSSAWAMSASLNILYLSFCLINRNVFHTNEIRYIFLKPVGFQSILSNSISACFNRTIIHR